MTDRYESRASTHADDCWSWGPGHYKCAVGKIERLLAEVKRLREALEDADNELDWLDEDIGIGCDHSAGVCTCDYWNVRRKMKAALSEENSND